MSAPRPRYLTTAAVAGVLAAAAIVAGCGNGNANDPAGQPGKQLFAEKCGSCHILEAAGTKGVLGPNLDAAFKDALDSGMKRSTVESVTLKQISLPAGKAMPADLVTGKDAEAVAEYVAESVGEGAPRRP